MNVQSRTLVNRVENRLHRQRELMDENGHRFRRQLRLCFFKKCRAFVLSQLAHLLAKIGILTRTGHLSHTVKVHEASAHRKANAKQADDKDQHQGERSNFTHWVHYRIEVLFLQGEREPLPLNGTDTFFLNDKPGRS